MTSGFREIKFSEYCNKEIKRDNLLHSKQNTHCVKGSLFLTYKTLHSDQWVTQDLKKDCECTKIIQLELEC